MGVKVRQFSVTLGIVLALLSLSIGIFSCAPKAQTATLNLSYTPKSYAKEKTNIKVAIVKPIVTYKEKFSESISTSPFGALLAQNMPADYRLKSKYYADYVQRLRNAMLTDLERIAESKGLKVVGGFDNIDEITYSDKKNIDYVIVPEFDFGPVIRNKRECLPVIGCQDKGTIQFVGNVKLVFYEPMSMEKIIIKRVDLSSIGYNNAVEYSGYEDADNKLMTLLNNIYGKIMARMEKILDVDELKHNLENVKVLKGKT